MIYEFITDKTKSPITNYLNDFLPNLKLLEYIILEYHTLDTKENNVKRFLFGFKGNTFKLYLSPSDTISISSDDRMPLSGEFHDFYNVKHSGGTSSNNRYMSNMKQYLYSFVRDEKLNQIFESSLTTF